MDEGALRSLASDPRVLAIGETGLDPNSRATIERQLEVLRLQAALSEENGKPLILHVVRRWDEIIAERRRLHPLQPWIVHGFRGGAVLAKQLVDKGFYLSLGERFNHEVPLSIPHGHLLVETDCSEMPIEEIERRTGIKAHWPFGSARTGV